MKRHDKLQFDSCQDYCTICRKIFLAEVADKFCFDLQGL